MLPYSEQGKFNNLAAKPEANPELDYFFTHAYHDMRFFLHAITKDSSSVYTYFGDPQKKLYYMSDNMRDTFGFSSNLVRDLPSKWRERIYKNAWKELHEQDKMNVIGKKGDLHNIQYQVADKNGNVHWIQDYERLQWNEDKSKIIFVAGRLIKQDDFFSVDPLTNFLTEHTLQYRLDLLQQYHYSCRAIGISLNHIAEVNAKYSRSEGDVLIKSICAKLTDRLVGKMTFYRLLGMRSVALIANDVPDTTQELVEEMRATIHSVYEEMHIHMHDPCSFAELHFDPDEMTPVDFTENAVSLIRMAETDYSLDYVQDTPENLDKINAQADMRMTLIHDVLKGMKNFTAVIQPIVYAQTGRIIAGETLMRWKYRGKDVSPGIFIPILESENLIQTAGRWILKQAIHACSIILKHIPDFRLSVNLSLRQLDDPQLLTDLASTLDACHLDGFHIVLEITESCMAKDIEKFQELIDSCHKLGVHLAIDDFGTGYSSMWTLMHYNIKIIKIDRSLLLEMEKSEEKSLFIRNLIDACHQMGKTICIEGAETSKQSALARNVRCDYIQGFYYYRPTGLEDLYSLVQKHPRK